jgi:hypothetical protein
MFESFASRLFNVTVAGGVEAAVMGRKLPAAARK